MRLTPHTVTGVATLCLFLAGCDDSPGQRTNDAADVKPTFSAAERAAARALSLGDKAALNESSGPYERASICLDALKNLDGILRNSGAMNAEMNRGLAAATRYYKELQRNSAPLAPASSEPDESPKTRSETARIGVACLQSLATEQP